MPDEVGSFVVASDGLLVVVLVVAVPVVVVDVVVVVEVSDAGQVDG